MSLAAASGSIRKDSRIVSLQHAVKETFCSRFVHIGLRGVLVEHTVERKGLVLHPLSLRHDRSCELLDGIVFRGIEYPGSSLVTIDSKVIHQNSYRHFSSTTLMTDRMPFCEGFGVGAAASDPSPRKSGPSSHLESCAASRMVKGRTRTVTEMEDAPSAAVMFANREAWTDPAVSE